MYMKPTVSSAPQRTLPTLQPPRNMNTLGNPYHPFTWKETGAEAGHVLPGATQLLFSKPCPHAQLIQNYPLLPQQTVLPFPSPYLSHPNHLYTRGSNHHLLDPTGSHPRNKKIKGKNFWQENSLRSAKADEKHDLRNMAQWYMWKPR